MVIKPVSKPVSNDTQPLVKTLTALFKNTCTKRRERQMLNKKQVLLFYLDTPQAAQPLISILLPLRDQVSICYLLFDAIIV